jgi:hypothetical protein
MTKPVKRDWTIMLYTMADQNRLRGFANDTLLDISRASRESRVKTVAQVTFHSSVVHPIRRYDFEEKVSAGRKRDVQNKLQFVPRKNINPPQNLVEFLHWGQRAYPAKRYCVVLQGHAWGVDYDMSSVVRAKEKRDNSWHQRVHLILGSPGSKNHLSNKQLQDALATASTHGKFHLLGMDSCVMGMAEIIYELHECTEYTVAPEGLGPIRGWPFYPILTALNKNPSSDGAALGALVLRKYSEKYREWGGDIKLTISLCSLRHSEELMKAMQGLARSLREGLKAKETCSAIVSARLQCKFIRIPTYIDLHHFCSQLKRESSVQPESSLFKACSRVETVLTRRFVQMVALKRGRTDAFGLSIYFPKWRIGGKKRVSKWEALPWTDPMATPSSFAEGVAKISTAYTDHEFAERSGWKEFLVEFLKARLVT